MDKNDVLIAVAGVAILVISLMQYAPSINIKAGEDRNKNTTNSTFSETQGNNKNLEPNKAKEQTKETVLGAQAAMCATLFEIGGQAESMQGTEIGEKAKEWRKEFIRIAYREGVGDERFKEIRSSFAEAIEKGGDEVFKAIMHGCLVKGEELGVIPK